MRKNILVTGASSGFGLLIANELHRTGSVSYTHLDVYKRQ